MPAGAADRRARRSATRLPCRAGGTPASCAIGDGCTAMRVRWRRHGMLARWWRRVGVGLATAVPCGWPGPGGAGPRGADPGGRAGGGRRAGLQIALLRVFRRSTAPLLIPFVGHGSPQRVELGARAVLGRPEARARRLPVPDGGVLAPARDPVQAPARRSRRSVLRTSLARFLTVEVADAAVTARTPGAVVTVRSDRDGYVDAVVTDPGLSPGWHDVELDLADGATVQHARPRGVAGRAARARQRRRRHDPRDRADPRAGVPPHHAAHRGHRSRTAARARRRCTGRWCAAPARPGCRCSTSPPARGTCTRCCWSSSRCAASRSVRSC